MSRDTARKVLEIESEAIRELIARLDESFDRAVETLPACSEVRLQAFMVMDARGGQGCLREFIEAILRARGDWDPVSAPGVSPR